MFVAPMIDDHRRAFAQLSFSASRPIESVNSRPSPAQLRIAQVVPGLTGGGLERMVTDLSRSLAGRGHHVEVFSVGDPGVYAGRLADAGISTHDCRIRGFHVPGVPWRLARALRSFHGDVLHAHSGVWYPTAISGAAIRVPVVFTDHGRYPPEAKLTFMVQGFAARLTAQIVTVSPELSQYVRDNLRLGFSPPVVENGIDLSPYRNPDPAVRHRLRTEWGCAGDDVVVTMLGRLEAVKDPVSLIEAVAAAGNARLRVVLVGAGSLEQQLRERVDQLGLSSRASFLGFRQDGADCLMASDILAMPSLTEGLPIALLEALAAGLPIIASAVGGIPAALGTPPAGILTQPRDVAGLTEALRRLTDDETTRRAMGTLARQRATAYTLDRMTDRYEAIYYASTGRRPA